MKETAYAREIKKAFQKAHIYISSDEDDDLAVIHKNFSDWRSKIKESVAEPR